LDLNPLLWWIETVVKSPFMTFLPFSLARRSVVCLAVFAVLLAAAGRIGQAAPDESAGREAVPTVTGVAPADGPLIGFPGITIIGTGFVFGDTVKFGGVTDPTAIVMNPTTIVATAPPAGAPGAVNVTVTNGDGQSVDTVLFTYHPAPAITALDPTSGPAAGGNTLKITGTNLNVAPAIGFGTSPPQAAISASATEIFVVVPAA